MNYGTLGFKIGEQLMEGFATFEDGNMNNTKEKFDKQLECFQQELDSFDLKDSENEVSRFFVKTNRM